MTEARASEPSIPPDPARSASANRGRHTLGSDHDSPRPAHPWAEGEHARDRPSDDAEAGFPVWWRSARERAGRGGGEPERILRRVLEHVESGWACVARLELVCERNDAELHKRLRRDARLPHLVAFIQTELVAAFGRFARETASAVPGGSGEAGALDPIALERRAGRFSEVLAVAHLAVADPAVPLDLREAVEEAAARLSDWAPELGALLSARAIALHERGGHLPFL